MRNPYKSILLSSAISILLSACGGGNDSDDPTKSVGNDGSLYQSDPVFPSPTTLPQPARNAHPDMKVPANPANLPASVRI